MSTLDPCTWTDCAKDKKGQTFELQLEGGPKKASVVLTDVQSMDLGGGYVGYTFTFEGKGGPNLDNIYGVMGGGCQATELFFVVSEFEGVIHYVASITCKS